MITKINPERYYSASEVVRRGWTWRKMVRSFTLFLGTEEGRRIYKPIVITRGAVKRYQIKGSAILEAMKAAEKGELEIDHGPTT